MSTGLLSRKQQQAYKQSTARINIAWGPVRSGKTEGLEIWRWIDYAINGPKGDLLMSGKTLKTLERNVLRRIAELLPVQSFSYSLSKKEARICGRRVELEGANDEGAEGKIRGMTLAGAMLNEITLQPESFFNQCLARMSVKGAKLFGTTNTDSPYHWLKVNYLDREESLNLRQWKFNLEDNPFLDPDYVESLKAEYTGLWYKRFILGLWVQAAGAVYDMWSDKNVQKVDPGKVRTWFADCDYGTSNPCTFSLKGTWIEDGKPRIHTFKEYYYDGRNRGQKTDAEYVEDLKAFIQNAPGRIPVYTDPSAASFITAGRKSGIRMVEASNEVLDGIRFVSSWVQDHTYTVDPSCKETIKGYQSYIWDEKAQKRGEDKPLKENDHTCDRDRYGIYTHFGGERRTKGGTLTTL